MYLPGYSLVMIYRFIVQGMMFLFRLCCHVVITRPVLSFKTALECTFRQDSVFTVEGHNSTLITPDSTSVTANMQLVVYACSHVCSMHGTV